MAMRRPRIKPVANIQLNSKRKIKSPNDVKPTEVNESDINRKQDEVKKPVNIVTTQPEEKSKSIENSLEVRKENLIDTTPANENDPFNEIIEEENNCKGPNHESTVECEIIENNRTLTIEKGDLIINAKDSLSEYVYEDVAVETVNDSNAFKCPLKVGFQRLISHTSNSGIDDVFYSDIEENALQMDLENSLSNSSISPSKNLTRQRIKPTPHFGQRRNSFVGSSPSPHTPVNEECSHITNDSMPTTQIRRERHHSASLSGNYSSSHHHYQHTPHKYLPTGVPNATMGRIRTESGCSVFSDTNTSIHKSRKTEDHKQNSRKDFEARFYNGVPEKSAIKMSDLIYYNPMTNPMEQKTNPNIKLEQTGTSNDVKPFTEKQEQEIDTLADSGESTPVPQLKLNAKGELILDDKSLVIETTAEQEARKVLANSSLIYLDENTGMNGFYSRQKRTREWIPSETIKFYRCLQNIGTDFSLMVSLFPNRTRRDLKLKFKKEERKNLQLINKALLYPKQFDIESLKEQINEEDKLRNEQAKRAKANKEKVKEKKRKIVNTSIAKRILINEVVYQNEQEPMRIRKDNDKSAETVENEKECLNENVTKACQIIINKYKPDDILQFENENISTRNDSIETASKSDQVTQNNKNEKQFKKIRKNRKPKKLNKNQLNTNNSNGPTNENSDNVKKRRRRRKRSPYKLNREEINIIKEEISKVENKQESYKTSAEAEYQETKQLQTEINELLIDSDLEIQNNGTYETPNVNLVPVTPQIEQDNEYVNASPHSGENVNGIYIDDLTSSPPSTRSQTPPIASQPTIAIENKTESLELTTSEPDLINTDTCSSVISEREERELNEDDIQSILTELAEGSLVLVSTLDPDDPDKVLNEIYMVDKNTGELCEEPLNIPDNIVQCILTVAS